VRIEKVQFALQVPARESPQVADEVPVDVVRMILVLDERAVGEDLANPDASKLSHEGREVLDKRRTPARVPGRRADAVSRDDGARAELIQRELVVTRWEGPIGRKWG
jgi:hypothetical protein